jgi:hypothetical protein
MMVRAPASWYGLVQSLQLNAPVAWQVAKVCR